MKASADNAQSHIPEADLVLLANGELTPERTAAAIAHLETCRRCAAELREIRQTLDGYFAAWRAGLNSRLPAAEPARAELQRRLTKAQAERPSWADRFTATPAAARWGLGLATFAIALAIGPLTSLLRPPLEEDAAANAGFAPDPVLTPGLTTAVSGAELCRATNDDFPPAVDRALALEVFRRHGILQPQPRAYEIDYLIPPELGGATDLRNLWPQPYDVQPWNAHAKDALENDLLRAVCDGRMDLAAAQQQLAGDWVAAYRKHFRTPAPLVEHASFLKDEPWQ